MVDTLIGLFSQALVMPDRIFRRSNDSRRPSFFTTIGRLSSTRSYVVYRRLQERHSRRRRMTWPSLAIRESTTLSSRSSQKGHFTRVPQSCGRRAIGMKHRESLAESLGLVAHLTLRPLVLRLLKHPVDQRDNLAHFLFPHAAG